MNDKWVLNKNVLRNLKLLSLRPWHEGEKAKDPHPPFFLTQLLFNRSLNMVKQLMLLLVC